MTYSEHKEAQTIAINNHLKMFSLQLKIELGKKPFNEIEYKKLCETIDETLSKELLNENYII